MSAETQARIAEAARRLKLEKVHDHGDDPQPGASDISNIVLVAREGEPIIMFHVKGPDGPRAGAYWAALLGRAEEVYAVADAFMRVVPADGPEVERGQLQREWEAGDTEGVRESLAIMRIPVEGPATMVGYPYERTGKKLRWLEVKGNTGGIAGGAIVDYALRGFENAKKSDIIQTLGQIGDDVYPGHYERAVGRFVSEQENIAMVTVLSDPPSNFIKGAEL